MFKRLFWLTIGASFGFGLSFWLTRMIKQTMARYAPQKVSTDLTSALRHFGEDLKAAAAEGRDAMREHEAALRADLADRGRSRGGDGRADSFQPVQPARPRRPNGARPRPLRATGRLRIDHPVDQPQAASR